jgi:flagellar M-ring protein FliF
VRAMLERVVGPGHADVRVTADIDSARVERLEEHYDPTKSALRSEEQSLEHGAADPNESVAGVPGAESNLPTGGAKPAAPKPAASASGAPAASSAAAVAAAAPGTLRESHTRNFEIDHVSEKRTVAGGALKRLTVAVVLDGVKGDKGMIPRQREELDKLATLVRSAAGASQARDDVVTVESMPFAASSEVPAESAMPAPVALDRLRVLQRWAPFAAGAVLLLAFAGVAMRRSKSAARNNQVLSLPAGDVPPSLEAAIRPALDTGDLRAQALLRATQDPATAALVLRFWLGTATPEAREA